MIKKIGHIGFAVKNIETVLRAFSKALNVPIPDIKDNEQMKIKSAMIDFNGVEFEILQPYGETGILADYIKKHGNGIHHICFLTDSIEIDMKQLQALGFGFRQEKPTRGFVRGRLRATTTDDALDGIPFEISKM